MARTKKGESGAEPAPARPGGVTLYTLDVRIISGMVTEEFLEKNPIISRSIQVRGDQTLETLHRAIFKAFGRSDEHMHEFQFGKKPHDKQAKRYQAWSPYSDPDGENIDGTTEDTTLDSLNLKLRQNFFYWFDFGDDWWHEITVTGIGEVPTRGKFPKVVAKLGKNPPQYPDFE